MATIAARTPSPAPTSGDRLEVGIVAPPWLPVPPPRYGGTETIIDLLARGLERAGHGVTLFATGDSPTPCRRRWVHPRALGTGTGPGPELHQVEAAYTALADVDLIHDHTVTGPVWSIIGSPERPPVVTTVHGRITPRLAGLYRAAARESAVVAISHHQRASAPSVPMAGVIHHGIDLDATSPGCGERGDLVFLGRMSPDKGAHRAIAVARAAGRPLVIAAKMRDPEEHRYFAERVEPLLGPDVRYVGELGGSDKHDLLAGAAGLLNPIRWPEPFGLVTVEALATGTPVLTFAEGAAPEIVDDGRTGFVCADEGEMARRVAQLGEIDRRDCRRVVAERFTAARMVEDHVALYRSVLAGRRAEPEPLTADTGGIDASEPVAGVR